jgi:hypothetical protein
METQLTLNGRKRKEAADCIGTAIGIPPVYMKAPTYAYSIGKAILDRNAVLSLPYLSKTTQSAVLSALRTAGFLPEGVEDVADTPVPKAILDRLVIQLPHADFSDIALDNLDKLIASKATLLSHALGTDKEALTIVRNGATATLDFPWFNVNATPDEIAAYTQLVKALCDMAKKQQRILATDKSVENEKYAFRCFLLRLGFIGETYATTRKILLQNLSGNGSHKSGNGKPRGTSATAKPGSANNAPNAGHDGTNALDEPETTPEPQPAAKPRFSFRKLFGALKVMALD